MKPKEIVKKLVPTEDEVENLLSASIGDAKGDALIAKYEDSVRNFEEDSILKGKIVNIVGDEVIVDVGYKSEGAIGLNEFAEPATVKVGDDVDVYLEAVEDDSGYIVLSKKRADRIRGWEQIINTHKEGDIVKGKVIHKIKGGLLVDIGVPVFLPASQVGLRRSADISEYIGQEVEGKIIKIDEERMNIVISRRRLIEEEREKMKRKLLDEIEEGQIRSGEVKNLADFGAFVDLGGIDGLLHITDMSWGRVGHPSELLKIGDHIDVKILKIDRERERIALGLKQKTENPWNNIEEKYPISSRVSGRVVNIMSYGAFVKLETGVEGLVHVSEMSWTKRINHPSEMVSIGDVVDVVVLDINKEKQEISLGMKQCEVNPWELVSQKYPPGTIVTGKVRNMTNYGAFIEIEEGIDGLLHISDMSWTKKIGHPSKMLKKGEDIQAMVLSVDQEKKRVALGLKQLEEDPWVTTITDKYYPGLETTGSVTKLTNFGVFVELEPDLEGLLHVSELGDKKIKSPDQVVKVGDIVHVKVIKLDPDERKIGLTLLREYPIESPGEMTSSEPAAPQPLEAPVPGTAESAPAAPPQPEETGAPPTTETAPTESPAPEAPPTTTESPAPEAPPTTESPAPEAPPTTESPAPEALPATESPAPEALPATESPAPEAPSPAPSPEPETRSDVGAGPTEGAAPVVPSAPAESAAPPAPPAAPVEAHPTGETPASPPEEPRSLAPEPPPSGETRPGESEPGVGR
jgi:small subunit ribosomal protein S1